jgi:hypothetical protein
MTVMIAMFHLSQLVLTLNRFSLARTSSWGGWFTPRPTPFSLNLTFRWGISEQLSILSIPLRSLPLEEWQSSCRPVAGMWKLGPAWLNSALSGINQSLVMILSSLREFRKLKSTINTGKSLGLKAATRLRKLSTFEIIISAGERYEGFQAVKITCLQTFLRRQFPLRTFTSQVSCND